MLQKTKGIVLHTLKYNDTSIIVDMYTELSGRASFLVTVPRSRKAAVNPYFSNRYLLLSSRLTIGLMRHFIV